MAEKREPMIDQQNRPTAIDFDMSISDFKLRDLYAVASQVHTEKEIRKTEKEIIKEKELKLEKEHFKPEKEKELFKGEKEKESFKPEKEVLKPEKELSKPEFKPIVPGWMEQIVDQVVERLKAEGTKK
jgi:hypothetical protein